MNTTRKKKVNGCNVTLLQTANSTAAHYVAVPTYTGTMYLAVRTKANGCSVTLLRKMLD